MTPMPSNPTPAEGVGVPQRANTPRQDRALSLLKSGLTISEIAERDGCSVRAIKNLLRKTRMKAERRLDRKIRRLVRKYEAKETS